MKLRDARIKIRTRYKPEEELGIVEIEDNGVGVEEGKLQELRREMRENQENGKIGLSNIYMRVHIFYENQGNMEIYSTAGKGT